MSPNNGMLGGDWVTAGDTTAVQASIHLLNTRVHSLQAVETLPELRRQTLVCLAHVAKQGVTACCGAVKDIQEGSARGLLLESDIRVPGNGVGSLLQENLARAVVGPAVNQVNLGEALGGSRGLMDVVTAEVSSIVDDLLDRARRKVLITEGCLWLALHIA